MLSYADAKYGGYAVTKIGGNMMKIWQKGLAAMMALGLVVSSAACVIPGFGGVSGSSSSSSSSNASGSSSSSSSSTADTQLDTKKEYFSAVANAFSTMQFFKLTNFDYTYTYTPAGAVAPSTSFNFDGELALAKRWVGADQFTEFELNVTVNNALDVTMYLYENNFYTVSQSNYRNYGYVDGFTLDQLVEGGLLDFGVNAAAAKAYAVQVNAQADFAGFAAQNQNDAVEKAATIVDGHFVLEYDEKQTVNGSANANWFDGAPVTASALSLFTKKAEGGLTAADMAAYFKAGTATTANAASFTKADMTLKALYDQRYDSSKMKWVSVELDLAVENLGETGSLTTAKLGYTLMLPWGLDDTAPTISVPAVDWTDAVLPL